VPCRIRGGEIVSSARSNECAGKMCCSTPRFNIRFGTRYCPEGMGRVEVRAEIAGHRVARTLREGAGRRRLIRFIRMRPGHAERLTLSYRQGGSRHRAGVDRADIFGGPEPIFRRTACCAAGVSALIQSRFRHARRKRDISRRSRTSSVSHDIELIVDDLILQGGLNYTRLFRERHRGTCDLHRRSAHSSQAKRMPRDEEAVGNQVGKYREGWIQENAKGRQWFSMQRQHRSVRFGFSRKSGRT